MIRQLKLPRINLNHNTPEEVYKPTCMMFMDCEKRPNSYLTKVSELGQLYQLYGTNSDNYNFRIAELLLSYNKLALMCINAKTDDDNKGTSAVYSLNGTQYEIHPPYTSFPEKSKKTAKNLTNGHYAYTLYFDSLERNYYMIMPYNALSELVIYFIADMDTYHKLNWKDAHKNYQYSNIVYNYEDEIISPEENYRIFMDDTWETFLIRAKKILDSFGFYTEMDLKKHTIVVTYTFKTEFIIGNLNIAYNDKVSDKLIYKSEYDNRKLVMSTKLSDLLDGTHVTVSRQNDNYTFEIDVEDSNGNYIDSEIFNGTDVEELVTNINLYSTYLYIDYIDYESPPLGEFLLKNYDEEEYLDYSNYLDILNEFDNEVMLLNRVDFVYYGKPTDTRIYNKLKSLVDDCKGRCMFLSAYDADYDVGNCNAIFQPYLFDLSEISDTDNINGIEINNSIKYDFVFYLLKILQETNGIETNISQEPLNYAEIQAINVDESEDSEDIRVYGNTSKFDINDKIPSRKNILIDINNNYYYYAILNPLCSYNGHVTTLDEAMSGICVINNFVNNLRKNATELKVVNCGKYLINSVNEVSKFFNVVPEFTFDRAIKEDRHLSVWFTMTMINNTNKQYNFNMNINY